MGLPGVRPADGEGGPHGPGGTQRCRQVHSAAAAGRGGEARCGNCFRGCKRPSRLLRPGSVRNAGRGEHRAAGAVQGSPQGLDAGGRPPMLGRFLFSGDDAYKSVSVLSGGERSRLALAKMLLRASNVLLMDEPTNHLDVGARETLEDALAEYPGTLVLASHDRYLIDKLANKVVEITGEEVKLYPGNYTAYRMAKAQEQANGDAESGSAGEGVAPNSARRTQNPEPKTRSSARSVRQLQ